MSGNGEPHEHEWHLFREEEGRVYEPSSINELTLGAYDELAYRPVKILTWYCSVCRKLEVDKEYGELMIPRPRPPRPRRRFPWLPVTWRPW